MDDLFEPGADRLQTERLLLHRCALLLARSLARSEFGRLARVNFRHSTNRAGPGERESLPVRFDLCNARFFGLSPQSGGREQLPFRPSRVTLRT